MKYAAHGKQVTRGSEHVADAADDTWAQIIADALNGERKPHSERMANRMGATFVATGDKDPIKVSSDRRYFPGEKFTFDAAGHRYEGVIPYHSNHRVTRHIDGYRCSCGHHWDSDAGGDECPVASARSKAWNDAKMRLMGPEYIMLPYQYEALRAMGIDHASGPSKTMWNRTDGHTWQRQQDEYACSCGARWEVSDGDEHPTTR